MAYIGNQADTAFTSLIKQDLTGASGTSLTLTHAVANANDIALYINNVRQEPVSAYSTNGTAVSLTGSVVNSDDIYVIYLARAVQTTVPPDGSVSTAKLADDAVTNAKIADNAVTNAKIADNASISGSKLGTDAIIQVKNHQDSEVAYTGNTIPNDDSRPLKTEGGEFMTLSITPKSASSKLFIQVVMGGCNTNANAPTFAALFKDDETHSIKAAGQYQSVATGINTVTLHHYMTAGTTSAITFKVRGGASAGNFTFNGYNNTTRNLGGVSASSITIMEIGG